MSGKTCLLCGVLLGMLGVALGAFGAHGLERAVTEWELSSAEQAQRLDNWEVAVRYQMYHALALLAVGILAWGRRGTGLEWAGAAFLFGVLVFSGCLYVYVFTGNAWWGRIVPIGGVAMIAGWLALGLGVLRISEPRQADETQQTAKDFLTQEDRV